MDVITFSNQSVQHGDQLFSRLIFHGKPYRSAGIHLDNGARITEIVRSGTQVGAGEILAWNYASPLVANPPADERAR